MIHNLVSQLRKTANLSQEELANKLGMSRQTLVTLEKGDRPMNLEELKRLSEIFEVPMEMILDDDLSVSQKVESASFGEKAFDKFQNLLLQCIKYGSSDDGKIPKTKLAKLVYLCDFASYYYSLRPISGFIYEKHKRGPVTTAFFELIDTDESIVVEKKKSKSLSETDVLLISLAEEPRNDVLSEDEMKLIKSICKKWKKYSTADIVRFTHEQIPWKVSREREAIPYALINNEALENVY